MAHGNEEHCTCMYWVEEMWQQKRNSVQGPEHMRVSKTLGVAMGQ